MLQTIQFDPDRDPLQEVLNTIARGYGYRSANHALGHADRGSGVPVPLASRISIAQVPPGSPPPEPAPDQEEPVDEWSAELATEFLGSVTRDAQRAIALMVIDGVVPLQVVYRHLGVRELRGTFSTVGAAVTRLGLKEPPYRRRVQPIRCYVMTEDKRYYFLEAFAKLDNMRFLEEAEKLLNTVAEEERVGDAK